MNVVFLMLFVVKVFRYFSLESMTGLYVASCLFLVLVLVFLLFYWFLLILFRVFAVILVLMSLFLNNIICGTVSSIFHYF